MSENNEYDESVVEHHAPTYEEMLAARRLTMDDVREHISGPMVSIVFHVLALAFLSSIIVFEAPKEGRDIVVKEVQVDIKELEKIPEPPEPEDVEVQDDIEIERPDITTDDVKVEVQDVAVEATAVDVQMPDMMTVKPTNSALVMPALMSSRTGKGRRKALRRYGGSSTTERSVVKGLMWLKEHQNEDGSWGENEKSSSALTGLALLAFLAHGETPTSTEYGQTVLKAIKKLVEFLGPQANDVQGGYRHGIVMYALAESYAVTKIPMLEDVLNKGMTKLIKGQNSLGSFNYRYDNKPFEPSGGRPRSDLSVAGWNYQALKAAFAAGCTSPGLEEAIDKAINVGLKRTHFNRKAKRFAYTIGKNGEATAGSLCMQAAGTLCLQLLGEGRSFQAKSGLANLETPNAFWFNWQGGPPTSKKKTVPKWALYQWYYQTQCFFQGYSGRGATWRKWNKMFTKELVKRQKRDGRWESPSFEFPPAKKTDGEGTRFKGIDQPVWATSLCCLMMEVYYRYLPTFKVTRHRAAASGERKDESDDLGLKLE
ncbi:MAG: terpene cyclase/mutase family protein [Kiritimatiellaeota bacterium]|nr:terpene cyclase/mutase family protein [Kiritimatiellota bacterium]